MDCATFVKIVSWNGVVLDYLDNGRFTWFLIVLNPERVSVSAEVKRLKHLRIANLKIQTTSHCHLEMSK